jgi:cation diffusion facilitator CzcD-associated flavoprotein CzcO
MTLGIRSSREGTSEILDAVIVGAGFSGLYSIYRLREQGLRVQAIERGNDVGGTWYWNKYPGARCDIESIYYSFSFSDELQKSWRWTRRYAAQPEILAYLNHVADRFSLRENITFGTTVTSAHFDEESDVWVVTTDAGDSLRARHLVLGSGQLSVPSVPDFPGIERFAGEVFQTSLWPDSIDFDGKKVGIVGTGSSCIQSAPHIAEEAEHLYVFQRTPQFAIPAWNREYSEKEIAEVHETYTHIREEARKTIGGIPFALPDHAAAEATPERRNEWLQKAWERGGYLMIASYPDVLFSEQTNSIVGDWVKDKLRARIDDPELAEKLMPQYPFAAKRLCVDTNYFEIYNRDNVTLVDLRESGIREFDENGIICTDGSRVDLDMVVLATGFDAGTGPLFAIDIRGRAGVSLREKWSDGFTNYLGISVEGFPNMYIVNGPGSPSALYNMIPALEFHIDWIGDTIAYLDARGFATIEPKADAATEWTRKVDEIAATTVYPKVKSWYMGDNIEGKVRAFMFYAGGGPSYFEAVNNDKASGYAGFELTPVRTSVAPCPSRARGLSSSISTAVARK